MLAIAGGKGGSGKTTTTLGLARALDGPVLAVDTDCDMPNLHALADVPRDPTLAAIENQPLEDITSPTADDVAVLPAPHGYDDRALGQQLRQLATADVAVLLDCAAGAGRDAVAPLRVADAVLLVSTLCAPALRDAAKTAAMARAVGTPVEGVVLTRTRLAPQAVAELFECPVLGTIPEGRTPVLDQNVIRASYAGLAAEIGRRPKLVGAI